MSKDLGKGKESCIGSSMVASIMQALLVTGGSMRSVDVEHVLS